MAKVIKPLFSVDAAGSVGRTTYRRDRRGHIACQRIKTQRSKSPAQLAQRAKYKRACTAWGKLSQPDKTRYAAQAAPLDLSGFNLFVKQFKDLGVIKMGQIANARLDLVSMAVVSQSSTDGINYFLGVAGAGMSQFQVLLDVAQFATCTGVQAIAVPQQEPPALVSLTSAEPDAWHDANGWRYFNCARLAHVVATTADAGGGQYIWQLEAIPEAQALPRIVDVMLIIPTACLP